MSFFLKNYFFSKKLLFLKKKGKNNDIKNYANYKNEYLNKSRNLFLHYYSDIKCYRK